MSYTDELKSKKWKAALQKLDGSILDWQNVTIMSPKDDEVMIKFESGEEYTIIFYNPEKMQKGGFYDPFSGAKIYLGLPEDDQPMIGIIESPKHGIFKIEEIK